ncbi:hypothetical protein KHA80_21865 [Anaerobacillus sp. HL2]|nr:hypothetical protein KHA80_21865 [Anaerobacillus sp. HL2]
MRSTIELLITLLSIVALKQPETAIENCHSVLAGKEGFYKKIKLFRWDELSVGSTLGALSMSQVMLA